MALVNLDLEFKAARHEHGFEGKRDAVPSNILLSGLELPCTSCDVQCVAVVSVLTLGAFYLNGKCFAFSLSLSLSLRASEEQTNRHYCNNGDTPTYYPPRSAHGTSPARAVLRAMRVFAL